MNPSLAFDTSALISLGHTELIELIVKHYNIVISERILKELKIIGKRNDEDANAANKWLRYVKNMELKATKRSKVGEEELCEICQKENIPMVTDDIKATKKFEDEIQWIFSVHVVFLLYNKDIITKERAIVSIEKMRTKRDWRRNIISVTAKILFE